MYEAYHSGRRRLSLRGIFTLVALLAVLCAAVLVLVLRSGSDPVSQVMELPFTSEMQYGFTDDGFLYIEGNTLHLCDKRGNEKSALELSGSGYSIATSPTIAAIYTDTAMQAIGKEGEALFPSQEFTGTVREVRCGKNYIAVLKNDISGTDMIYIYDLTGKRLDILSLEGNFLLEYGFYSDKDNLWTLALNTEGATPACTATTFNTGQSMTGIMTMEGQIIERLEFTSSNIYACATNHLVSYSMTGKEEQKKLIYGWKVLDFANLSKATFLMAVRTDSLSAPASAAAKVLTLPDEKEYSFRLPAGTLGAYIIGEKIYAVTGTTLITYDLQGVKQKEAALPFTAEAASREGNGILLRTGTQMYLLPVG